MIATTRIALLVVLLAPWLHPAVAQMSTNGSNTIVRFHFYHGTTTLGDVDVELFDTDKPVTVSNFLHYVRSGAYDNLMLHRCDPGFVIQGGAVRTLNPLSTAFLNFYGLTETPKFGPITNEFGAGPQWSNTFGTLAMARAVDDFDAADLGTNSAQSDWFFNLGDNSARLDTNYGGFTVFGRVVAGANVLDFFNRTSATLGVVAIPPVFGELPVAYTNLHYPRFSEVYHVRITDFGVTNTTRPTITVTYPAANARLTNASLMMTGTAADDQQLSSLWYRHSYIVWDHAIFPGDEFVTGPEINVPGSNVWALPIHLLPGTNDIRIQSVDNSGLRSAATVVRQVFYSLPYPISLTNVGNGRISGATNQQRIEIGKFVNLTAVPAPNHMIYGWSGRYRWDQAKLFPVPMQSNLLLTATFVTNPFPPLKASYSGLFIPAQTFTNSAVLIQTHYISGGISFSVTDRGGVSGKLRMATKTYPFSGAFHPSGVFRKTINRSLHDPLEIELILDVTNRSDVCTGSISDGDSLPPSQFFFLSEVNAYRVRPGTTAVPSGYAGKHTFMIPGTNNAALPFGDTWGTATINYAGTISAKGTLADNTPFSFSGPVHTNGLLPFYTAHNGGRSSVFGWVQFDDAGTNDDSHGQMYWFKKPPNPGKPYPNGFNYFPILTGSRYTSATSTYQVLGFSNAVVILSGGNLSLPSTNDVFLRTNNTVLNLDTNKLTFTIVKPSGQFIGTVTPINNARSIPFKGALLKRQDRGAGFFVSTNVTGQVYFGE
ncbi:MAG TPA: peptidylprolyl isomerase [Verrucomicrobiae bacterium]|nr:peptidylprolyl isomerase [Verrucomicrobiae bacterium]